MAADPTEGAEKLVYANWMRISGTPFDLSLDLGYHNKPGPPDTFGVRVVMSFEHAKQLLTLVAGAVEQYEAQAGPIRDLEGAVSHAPAPPEKSS